MLTRVSAHSTYSHKTPHSHSVTVKMIACMASVLYDDGDTQGTAIALIGQPHPVRMPFGRSWKRCLLSMQTWQEIATRLVAYAIDASCLPVQNIEQPCLVVATMKTMSATSSR